jgi:hypothetical protein
MQYLYIILSAMNPDVIFQNWTSACFQQIHTSIILQCSDVLPGKNDVMSPGSRTKANIQYKQYYIQYSYCNL